MKTVENGSFVKLHYRGTFPDGEVFDDSRLRDQMMEIVVGKGEIIKGFEQALIGMTEGETKVINLSSEEAYGPPRPEMIVSTSLQAFPDNFEFEVGMKVQGKSPTGQIVLAEIISYDEDNVVLDHNHPLAGKDINFQIELVQIEGDNEIADYNKLTVKELKAFAKNQGLKGFSTMKKSELIELLTD
jgi:peptidylprolyl isomerase